MQATSVKTAGLTLLLGGLMLITAPASARVLIAGDLDVIAGYPDFGLTFSGRDLAVEHAGGSALIELQSYGLSFYEVFSDHLKLGILASRIDARQSNQPTTTGMTLSGYHLAFAAKAEIPIFERLRLRAGANLGYTDLDGRTDAQTSSLSWNELNASLELWLNILPSVRLMGGAGWTRLDGEEASFGLIDANRDFELDDASTRRLGLEFIVDRSGFVGLTFEQGASEGFMLYFQRAFR